jgi:hypothetical protein
MVNGHLKVIMENILPDAILKSLFWAQVAFKADTGRYLWLKLATIKKTEEHNKLGSLIGGTTPDYAFIHSASPSNSWAQWSVTTRW